MFTFLPIGRKAFYLLASRTITSKYGATRLVYFEEHETAIEAIAREKAIKRWKRSWKFELVESINPDSKDLWGMIAS